MDHPWCTSSWATLENSLLAVGASLLIYWLLRCNYHRYYQLLRNFGPTLVGRFGRIFSPSDFIPAMHRILDESKFRTTCIWVGFYPVVLTADPDVIAHVLSCKDLLNKPQNLTVPLKNAMGDSVLISENGRWQRNRRLIAPSLHHKVILSQLPVFNKAKDCTLARLSSLVGAGEHKLSNILQRTLLAVSMETTMGKKLDERHLADEDLAAAYSFLIGKVSMQVLLSYINFGAIFALLPTFRRTKKYWDTFVDRIIKDKLSRTKLQTNRVTEETEAWNEDAVTSKKTVGIFIDHAIQLYQQQQFNWDDIVAESNIMIISSFETLSTVALSTIIMLAMHPAVQEKLYAEVAEVFPHKDCQIGYEHMKRLPYLDRVTNETMRLMPAIPFIVRSTAKEIQLTEGLVLPEDTQIAISIFSLQRRTDIWGTNANNFDPDHFLPENLSGKHAFAYIPFSKGARSCIGGRYAMLLLKVFIAGLVRNYRFTTTYKFGDLKYVWNVTMKYLDEPGVEIHQR